MNITPLHKYLRREEQSMIAETYGNCFGQTEVDFIKSNINTPKDIGDIAGALRGCFVVKMK